MFWYPGSDRALNSHRLLNRTFTFSRQSLRFPADIFLFQVRRGISTGALLGSDGRTNNALTMIFIGAALIERSIGHLYLRRLPRYTGIKMFKQQELDIQPEDNPLVKIVTRYIRSPTLRGEHSSTSKHGKRAGTLLLLVLIIVEVTDLVFAVIDSAIFAITTNTFIVYTYKVLRSWVCVPMYFLLAGVVEKFQYLKMGLASF